jgi:hypothetical protein
MRQFAQTLRRHTGVATGEVDRLTAQVTMIARRTAREVAAVQRTTRHALARRPPDGWLRRFSASSTRASTGR